MWEKFLEFLQGAWDFFIPFFVVDAWQRAIVLRLGVSHRECAPGFRWRIPFFEHVIDHTVVSSVHALTPQSLFTSDGHCCVISAIVTWRVSDVKKLLLDVEDAKHALLDACHGIISERVASSSWNELTAPGFLSDAQKEIRRRAFRWGVEVTQVQFCDLQRCKSLRVWQESRYRD